MPFHRLKHSFSAGELSPLMESRLDFSRYQNGCKKLQNMLCTTQGPVTRRPGLKFLYDLSRLSLHPFTPNIRLVPFIFGELQSFVLIFYYRPDGRTEVVFGHNDGIVVYDELPPEECPPNQEPPVVPDPPYVTGDVVTLLMPIGFDIDDFDWAQSADEVWIAQPDIAPLIIRRWSTTGDCWDHITPVFIDQPTDWGPIGDPAVNQGWPERVTFHQQRIVFAATFLKRQTVWMSRAGDFYDFGKDTAETGDADAITFTLDSGTQNKIVWLLSGKSLNIGTLGNEWTVIGSTRTALTPSNVLAQRQTNLGSEPIKPLMIGLTALFIERFGRSINEFVYDFNTDSYKSSDMSILSKHVTDDFSIVDWAYQQTPDSILWSIRSDGKLLGTTYQRQHEVIGWHVHDTKGEFRAITSIPGRSREDEVWVVVERRIEGELVPYLERFSDQFRGTISEEGYFLDSYTHIEFGGEITYRGDAVSYHGDENLVTYHSPQQVIGHPDDPFTYGLLDHLEGQTVDILADRTVHDRQMVVNGMITLSRVFKSVVIGLSYVSEVWPTLKDLESKDGTALGRMQRITTLDIDFYKTLGVHIGRWDSEDGEQEEYVPFRVPGDLTGQAVPLYTGIYHVDFPEGFDRAATYFIRQRDPLPLTIRAVVDTIEVQN